MTAIKTANRRRRQSIHPDWISKTLAGGVGGLALALALLGIFTWLSEGGIQPGDKVQVVMWLVPPVWLGFFSCAYLFPSGRQACFWIGVANLLGYTALFSLQRLAGF